MFTNPICNSPTMTLNQDQKHRWEEDGFLILRDFYSKKTIDDINALVESLWENRKSLGAQYVIDVFLDSEQQQRLYLSDAPTSARDKPYKLNDLFLSEAQIRELVVGEKLAPILKELLQGFPMVCNTLNFEFGSEQDFHFDTFYMPSPTPNKMVASWIALEQATPENGPLNYYPGSHKIPPYLFSNGSTIAIDKEMPAFHDYIYAELDKRNLKPQTLLADKGDLLIWHSQLFHGGSAILDKSQTRKSLVTHYFTKEDFPIFTARNVCEHGSYMARSAQAGPYENKFRTLWRALVR